MREALNDLAKVVFFLACMMLLVALLYCFANGIIDKSILHAAVERVGLK